MSKIILKKYFILLLLALILVLLPPPVVGAQNRSGVTELPLPARRVLFQVAPLLEKKSYKEALQLLLNFQGRDKSKTGSDRVASQGYHHPEIYFALGNCYFQLKQYKLAAAAYEDAVARNQEYSSAWLNLARTYYEMEAYDRAGRGFASAYETAANRTPELLYYSAVAYLQADDYAHSIKTFEQLLLTYPDAIKPEWRENLVYALLAADQPRRALPYIRELADTCAGDQQHQWQEILLYQYMQLKMTDQAIDFARFLTLKEPTRAQWWKALSHIQLNSGHEEEALAALTIFAFLTPLSIVEKKLLADLNLQLGIPVKAVTIYESCLKKEADHKLLQRLVMAYRQLGQPEKALQQINAVTLDPKKDGDLVMLKGDLLYSLQQFAAAAAAYRQVGESGGPNRGRAWLMAGYAAWQTDDIVASKTAFTKAAKYKREKKAATTALNQLTR